MHTRNGAVERSIRTIENLVTTWENDEKYRSSAKSYKIYNAHRIIIDTIWLTSRKKPKTELTDIVKDGKSYLSDWSWVSVLSPARPKIPIFIGRGADGKISKKTIIARTKTKEKQLAPELQSPKKKVPPRYLSNFVETNHNRTSSEGRFQTIKTKPELAEPEKNWYGKNNSLIVFFRSIISDQEKKPEHNSTSDLRQNYP